MKEIPLTQGQVAIVDDEDFESLSRHKWYYLKDKYHPRLGYAVRNVRVNGKRTLEVMHRVILGLKSGEEADHEDRIGTHNWRSNLRKVTRTQNQLNRRLFKNNKVGVRGITQPKSGNRFYVRSYLNGQVRWHGSFSKLEDAIAARMEGERQIKTELAPL